MAPYAATRHLQHSMRFLLLALFLLPWVVWAPSPASAQTRTALWSVPVNISRSGAASQPVVFAAPDGLLQAFWWDRFDGLMTAVRSGEAWSEPLPAQIYVTETVGVKLISRPLEAMPTLVADADGRVHAFWQGPADPDTGLRPLLHSRSPLGTVAWNTPDMVADGTIAMEAAALPDGGLALAYIRQARTASGAPGLYVRRLDNQGAWGRATPGCA
jgi:hypothetical protein